MTVSNISRGKAHSCERAGFPQYKDTLALLFLNAWQLSVAMPRDINMHNCLQIGTAWPAQ